MRAQHYSCLFQLRNTLGENLSHRLSSDTCYFNMEKNGVIFMRQKVQEMCFTATWSYPRTSQDSYNLTKPQRRGTPIGNMVTGAHFWAFWWIKPGLLKIWPYRQRPPCHATLLNEEELGKEELNFKGDQISPQAPICHVCELETLLSPVTLKISPVYFS